MPTKPDRTMRGVAIACWVIGAGALAGAVALAVQGNLGGTVALVVFGAAWAGFGFLTRLVGGATAHLGADAPARAAEAPEREWWLERADWAEGKIREDTTIGSRLWMIGGSVLTGLGLAGALANQLAAWEPGGFGFLLLGVGAFMLIAGTRAKIRARKFGVSVLECRTMPARVGERFQAVLQTGVPLEGQAQRPFHVRLRCVEVTTSGMGNDKRTDHKTLWTHEETVAGTLSAAGPTFQVRLDLPIPDGVPPSSPPGWEDRTYWKLRVRTETAGVDYAAEFEVPVARALARTAEESR